MLWAVSTTDSENFLVALEAKLKMNSTDGREEVLTIASYSGTAHKKQYYKGTKAM